MTRGIPPVTWTAESVGPLDNFEQSTLTLEQWLHNVRTSGVARSIEHAWVDFNCAIRALTDKMASNDWEFRCEPRVAYDPKHDTHYFIFKMNEDGETIVVSRRPRDIPDIRG